MYHTHIYYDACYFVIVMTLYIKRFHIEQPTSLKQSIDFDVIATVIKIEDKPLYSLILNSEVH